MSAERPHIVICSLPGDLGYKDLLFWWFYADILWRDVKLQRLPVTSQLLAPGFTSLRAPGLAVPPCDPARNKVSMNITSFFSSFFSFFLRLSLKVMLSVLWYLLCCGEEV